MATLHQREASGSWGADDPKRDRWDDDTTLAAEFRYHHPDGTYAFTILKGEHPDGKKRFLAGLLCTASPDLIEVERREQPGLFFRFPGLSRYKVCKKEDQPALLYRVDELLADMAARPSDPVFICEGEKDVETARDLGRITTTNPNGSGKWREPFNPYFADRDVVIVADNDDRGRAHAVSILTALDGIARSIKILDLPGEPENGDLTSWIEAGNTADDLQREVDRASNNEPPWVRKLLDKAEYERLAGLDEDDYDRERKDVAERLGIKVSTLDKKVAAARRDDSLKEMAGGAITFEEIEPWPEPVDGKQLVNDMVDRLKRHVIFQSDHHPLAVALWAIHAHLIDVAEHSPRLHIAAPAKRCGKTVLLDTVAVLVPRPLPTAHITSAALFRVVEQEQPTLLIDEVDTFLHDNEEMRGLLNAGHQPGKPIIRCVGDNFELRGFETFAATALAGIGEIPPTIEDRSITVPLRRRLKSDGEPERLRHGRAHLAELAQRIARWVADNRLDLSPDPKLPDALGDRAQDNWRQMVAIADRMGWEVSERARAAAIAMELEKDDDDSNDIALLAIADVHAVFEAAKGHEALASATIVEKLHDREDRPWRQFGKRGVPLTQNMLARLLKSYAVRPEQIKALNLKGYRREPVDEAYERYCAAKMSEGSEADVPF